MRKLVFYWNLKIINAKLFWNIKKTLDIFIKRKRELWNLIITLTSKIKEKTRLVSPAISYIWKPTLDTILSSKTSNTLLLNGFHRTRCHIDTVKLCIYVMVFERLLKMSYHPSPYPCQISKEKGAIISILQMRPSRHLFQWLVEDTKHIHDEKTKNIPIARHLTETILLILFLYA